MKVPSNREFILQPGEKKWLLERSVVGAPVAVQVRFADTLKKELDRNSRHPSVVLNVAESSFLATWKFIVVSGEQEASNTITTPAQLSNLVILKKTAGPDVPGPGGLCTFWSVTVRFTSVSIHPDGSKLEKKASTVGPLAWLMLPARVVVG